MKDKQNIPVKPKVKKEQTDPQVEVLKNQLARALADYDNLRRRTDEERINFIKYASRNVVQDLLPVLDNFENAQIHLKDGGLAIAISQFKDLLKQEGLQEISPKQGDVFDHDLMEVTEVVEGKEDGKVAEMVSSGWKFADGMVVRHAKVKVYKNG